MNYNEEIPDFLGEKAAPCSSMPQAANMWINSLILERSLTP